MFRRLCHHQLARQYPEVPRRKPNIVGMLPAAQILLHRLAVKEDNRHIRCLCLVDDNGRRRAIHDIDTDHIVAPLQKAIYLLVLRGLTFFAVGNI